MGTWSVDSFGNDFALDLVLVLCQGGTPAVVRATLERIIEEGKPRQPSLIGRLLRRRPAEPYPEADVAMEALVAAEIVACWLGHPPRELPEGLGEWIEQHRDTYRPELAQLARQAVLVVRTISELKDCWEESVSTEWNGVIEDLERRLSDGPPASPR